MSTARLRKLGDSIGYKAVIKTRNPALFVCMLALLVFFSHTGPLQAHEIDIPSREGTRDNHGPESLTVDEVSAGDEEEMKAFMLHVKYHAMQLTDYNTGLAPFLQLLEEEGGDWRKDSIYIFRTSGDGVIQQPHPYYPPAQGGTLSNKNPVMKQLMDELQEEQEGVACHNYTFMGENRAACAVKFNLHLDSLSFPLPTILVGGLHHNFSDVSFSNLKCPHYVPETSAVDVVDRDTLKKFVDEFAQFYVDWRGRIGLLELINSVSCFRVSPWKNDSIYLFAMTADTRLVVLNGNTPSLENKSLDVEDENGTNVGNLLAEAVSGLSSGEGAFVEYLWDDPTTPDDDTRDSKGNLIPGKAPGNSPKTTYVTWIPSSDEQGRIIWGSGIYNETSDDDGCAIASSSETPGNAVLNFFMTVLLLLPAVFLGKRSGVKRTSARSGPAAFLVFALATVVFLSGTPTASAHQDQGGHSESITAGNVTETGEMGMLEFVMHAKEHWKAVKNPNENIRFEKSLTVDGGDWKNGTIYLMVIDEEGTIYTNAHDPSQQNGTLLHSSEDQPKPMLFPEVNELVLMAEQGGCITYVPEADEDPEAHASEGHDEHEERVACSVKFTHPVWKADLILIAGYHHDHEEHDHTNLSFDNVTCPYFVSKIINEEPYFKQGVTANKVRDKDTLKSFVGEFRKHLSEQVEQADKNPARIATIRNCWRALPWKYEAVYLFVMTEEEGLVFFNGNSPSLENVTLNVVDENGDNVGDLIVNALKDKDEHEGAFVEYLWDDPTTPDDDTRDSEGNSIPGKAPGNSPKITYVEKVSFPGFLGGQTLIIGSGYHPETDNDDGGCAVAGTSANARGALLNLLAVLALMFSLAMWKKGPRGKQIVFLSQDR